MLKLKHLPNQDHLEDMACRFPEINPVSVKACLLLLRLSSDMVHELDSYLASHGLSQGNFFCLTVMNREPETAFSANQLSAALGVSSATMTGLLNKLENDGYIERSIDSDDRRKLQVRLSDKGRNFLGNLLPHCFCSITGFMSRLSGDEQTQLTKFLELLAENMHRLKELHTPPA